MLVRAFRPSEKHQREKAPREGNFPGVESAPLCSLVDSVDPAGGIVLTSGSSLRGDLPRGRGDLWSPSLWGAGREMAVVLGEFTEAASPGSR